MVFISIATKIGSHLSSQFLSGHSELALFCYVTIFSIINMFLNVVFQAEEFLDDISPLSGDSVPLPSDGVRTDRHIV